MASNIQALKSINKNVDQSQLYGNSQQIVRSTIFAEALVDTGDPCGKSELGKISGALRNLFKQLKLIRKYGQMYVNEVLSDLSNIRSLIKDASSIIASALRTIVQRLRNFIISKIRGVIQAIVDKIFTTLANTIKGTIVQKIINQILCEFTRILDGIVDFVSNFLSELVGKVINIPLCAAQQFANSLINNLAANIDKALMSLIHI